MPIKKDESNLFQIEDYQFSDFNKSKSLESDFEFQELDSSDYNKKKNFIKPDFEYENALKNSFEVEEVVRKHRRHDDYNKSTISKEVDSQVKKIETEAREKAYEEGYAQGVKNAKEEWDEKLSEEVSQKVKELSDFTEILNTTKEQMIKHCAEDLLDLVKSLTKWLLLREIKEDPEHIKRTLAYLLNEADSFKNLIITLDQSSYEKSHKVMDELSEKVEGLKNYKIVSDPKAKNTVVRVETDKNILDASLEKQFEKIEQIFEQAKNGQPE